MKRILHSSRIFTCLYKTQIKHKRRFHMVFRTKLLKIGGAVILVTAALVIGLSVGLSQEVRRAARQSIKPTSRRRTRPTRKPTNKKPTRSIKPTSRRPTRPTRKPTNRTPTRRPTTKIPTPTQKYTVLEKVKHDQTSFT